MSSDTPTVGMLLQALVDRFPAHWAEEWDRVGLITGDAAAHLSGVLVTLDATAEAIDRACSVGANLLVTHHPPYLDLPERIVAGQGPAGALEAAIRRGVAIVSLHTNLDRSPAGASALSRALGFSEIGPLEVSAEPVVLLVTYAPADAIPALRAAMSAAGAGRLGEYESCAFTVEGRGLFEERPGARPAVPGDSGGVAEVRLEMVAPLALSEAVVAAARGAHPYEEPVVLAVPSSKARGVARLGRVCVWDDGATLGDLAAHVGGTLGVACRVWGDPERPVQRIAVANGSAGSLIPEATTVADTLVAGEVRYHDALAASASGLAIIEAGHDATEWPIVHVLADAVRDVLGTVVPVTEEPPAASWWTMEAPDD